ncbi:MAG: copper resistance protein B [Sulfuricaulis sp.]|uniref:copper resistance protein B n=1 Tax=Sulfuricaulis sp. TaxID=2003553 RepID=UPI0025FF0B98|nr:copper resistance protein B [Sulfuricaulis sp.]MCR4346218.1 copper resistance protein B [Sulfuricaulis sp.]
MMNSKYIFIAAATVFWMSSAWAQEPATPAMPEMDHSQMDHSDVQGRTSVAEDRMSGATKMGHGPVSESTPQVDHDMGSMDHGSMQGGSPPPDARDPHAYSGGYTLPPDRPLRMADEHNFGSLMIDRLERVRTRDNSSTVYDLQAWYGRTYDRVVLKAEGDVDDGKLQDAHTQMLWGHAISAYWDTQLGVRHDSGEEPSRTWLAFGVQGLAPYWFEMDITGYVGEHGRTALSIEAEYELLLTQKLILQPRVEANFFGKRDAERETGSGLSDLAAGVRLRYEIRRELAPYIGIERSSKFGGTADFVRAEGKQAKETRVVAGLRFWF